MDKAKVSPRRKAIHLPSYDYTSPGYYFVTICTLDKRCLFGEIVDGQMHLNAAGEMVNECWRDTPDHFAVITLDEFVVMPNHVHGIIRLGDIDRARHASPLRAGCVALGTVVGRSSQR